MSTLATGATLHRQGAGPDLVLIHGLGLDHRAWEMAAGSLAGSFTVHTYDLPGHGARPVPVSYTIDDLAAECRALLEAAGIRRAHVAGYSLGGLVAQALAADHPSLVDRLVLIDTTPRYDATWQQIWRERAELARRQGTQALREALLKAWFTDAFLAADGPAVRYVRDALAAMPGEAYALGCEALAGADLHARAASIRLPTLVVCGEEDGPLFRDAAQWFVATLDDARLAWIPGKHAAVLENPAQFAAAAANFLGVGSSQKL
jgi:3-oxoadipate enol-lactonase